MEQIKKMFQEYKTIEIDELDYYMRNSVKNFYVVENTLYDQAKRIFLADKYNYAAYSTVYANVMELYKRSNN